MSSATEIDAVTRARRRPRARPLPPELLVVARKQHLALTGQQASGILGERGLRSAVRTGTLVRLWRNAFAVPDWQNVAAPGGSLDGAVNAGDEPTVGRAAGSRTAPASSASRICTAPVRTRLAAAELTLGGPVTACLSTAAELYGFGIGPHAVTHIVGIRPTALASLMVHRTPPIAPLQRAGRFCVVHPAETAVRAAARTPHPAQGLALLDAALRTGFVVPSGLTEIAGELHIDGIGLVRTLIPLADARAESPPESWLRWLCHDAGLPRPVPQFWVRCRDGSSYRLDLAWPRAKLALEYDGVEFHTGAALTKDRARLNALTAEGWTVLAVTAPMLTGGRDKLVSQIVGELSRAGAVAG